MTDYAPEASQNYEWQSNTEFFVRAANSTHLADPGSTILLKAALEGTKKVDTITAEADVAAANDGLYFLLPTVTNLHVFWLKIAAGQPVVAGATAYHEVEIISGETAIETARKIKLVMDNVTDIIATRVDAILTVTNLNGGVCDGATDGDTGWSIANTTSGAGTWTKFGEIKDDAAFPLESGLVVATSKRKDRTYSKKLNATFNLLNFSARNWNVVRDRFMMEDVDIAVFDEQNDISGFYYDTALDATPDQLGEHGAIMLTANAIYTSKNLKGTTPNVEFFGY